jgi:hypothetical protein
MQENHVINASYYCGRTRPGGPILVYTTGAYLVAEYDERTGNASWQRVVQASQKASIENWLSHRFPPNANQAKAKAAGK